MKRTTSLKQLPPLQTRSAYQTLTADQAADVYFLVQQNLNSARRSFDVFLSHSFLDKETVARLHQHLSTFGLKVYVDWIHDRQLSREHVSAETAAVLRERMRQSMKLLYCYSARARESRWMPWELGYFDGLGGSRPLLLPIDDAECDVAGLEYVGLYNAIELRDIPTTLVTGPGALQFGVPVHNDFRTVR